MKPRAQPSQTAEGKTFHRIRLFLEPDTFTRLENHCKEHNVFVNEVIEKALVTYEVGAIQKTRKKRVDTRLSSKAYEKLGQICEQEGCRIVDAIQHAMDSFFSTNISMTMLGEVSSRMSIGKEGASKLLLKEPVVYVRKNP